MRRPVNRANRAFLRVAIAVASLFIIWQGVENGRQFNRNRQTLALLNRMPRGALSSATSSLLGSVMLLPTRSCGANLGGGQSIYLFTSAQCPTCEAAAITIGNAPLPSMSIQGVDVVFAGEPSSTALDALTSLCKKGHAVSTYQIVDIETYRLHTGFTVVPTVVVLDPSRRIRCAISGDVPLTDLNTCGAIGGGEEHRFVLFRRYPGAQLPALPRRFQDPRG